MIPNYQLLERAQTRGRINAQHAVPNSFTGGNIPLTGCQQSDIWDDCRIERLACLSVSVGGARLCGCGRPMPISVDAHLVTPGFVRQVQYRAAAQRTSVKPLHNTFLTRWS